MGGWVGRRGRGRDPTCDCYGGMGEPSVVAKVHVCGIELPRFISSLASPTRFSNLDKFINIQALSVVVPQVTATITMHCLSSCTKISNFAGHFASIINPFMSYSR